jgi:hypothetical protein
LDTETYLSQNQRAKIKMTNQKANISENVVRGFSLVPGQDRTTLKGRTAIVFGIKPTGLPRIFQVLASVILHFHFCLLHFSLFCLTYNPAPQHLIRIIEHNGLPRGYRLLWLSEVNIHGVVTGNEDSLCLF